MPFVKFRFPALVVKPPKIKMFMSAILLNGQPLLQKSAYTFSQ
jgi:hypothetical protein